MASKYREGDRWPTDVKGGDNAVPVMICPCGCHCLETNGGHRCESCGRVFDDRGNRIVDEGDLDEDGELMPIMDGLEGESGG